MDYTISHPEPLLLVSEPVPVTVRLLNDREAGEDFEIIILTLHQDEDLTPSNIDQILSYPTVQITIQDNDRTFTNCYNYSACPHLALRYIAETTSQHRDKYYDLYDIN